MKFILFCVFSDLSDNLTETRIVKNSNAEERFSPSSVNNERTTEDGCDGEGNGDSNVQSTIRIKKLAQAGNVQELIEVLDKFLSQLGHLYPDVSFLHDLAEQPKCLKEFFGQVVAGGKMDFVEKILINTDSDGFTFLVIAFSNVMNKAMESDVIEVMDMISETCKKETALALFNEIHKYDEHTLLHLAVD